MCINDPTPSLFLRIVFSPVCLFFPLYPYQGQSFIRNSRLLYLVLKYKPISNFHCGCCHLFRAKSEKKVMNRIEGSFLPPSFSRFFFSYDPTTPSTGNATRLCDANGRWTGSEPKCQPIACGDPVTFPHTTVALINGSTSWKAVAQFSCIFGYQPFNGKLNFVEKLWLKLLQSYACFS